ncbi:hypothetical protein RND71_038522 [Anisodus tanguticus]|uniref:Uncharacterized protein n=1 Tax=Anisodus tanguticus TaxID=243964 RepID=A0AAE1R0I7_9SOLA|nr:hypothetical protein RND71_038522 [Anisodus tanguticus]
MNFLPQRRKVEELSKVESEPTLDRYLYKSGMIFAEIFVQIVVPEFSFKWIRQLVISMLLLRVMKFLPQRRKAEESSKAEFEPTLNKYLYKSGMILDEIFVQKQSACDFTALTSRNKFFAGTRHMLACKGWNTVDMSLMMECDCCAANEGVRSLCCQIMEYIHRVANGVKLLCPIWIDAAEKEKSYKNRNLVEFDIREIKEMPNGQPNMKKHTESPRNNFEQKITGWGCEIYNIPLKKMEFNRDLGTKHVKHRINDAVATILQDEAIRQIALYQVRRCQSPEVEPPRQELWRSGFIGRSLSLGEDAAYCDHEKPPFKYGKYRRDMHGGCMIRLGFKEGYRDPLLQDLPLCSCDQKIIDDFFDGAVIAINQVRLELKASKGSINVLNMTLDQVKIERDGLKEKVEALEAMKFFEVNKAMNLEEKVLKMKMLTAAFLFHVSLVGE